MFNRNKFQIQYLKFLRRRTLVPIPTALNSTRFNLLQQKGAKSMSSKELNKMLEMLPEADKEKLELVAKGMLMAQKSQNAQQTEDDKQSA